MPTELEILDSCVCTKARAAARALTNAYDVALKPAGLRSTQFAVLAALGAEGSLSITALAQRLAVDRSTLSRNLGPLEKAGLIKLGGEGWRRSRQLEVTKKGRAQFDRAVPMWEAAQRAVQRRLGERNWGQAHDSLQHLLHTS